MDDAPAEHRPDRLMPQAHPEDGDLAGVARSLPPKCLPRAASTAQARSPGTPRPPGAITAPSPRRCAPPSPARARRSTVPVPRETVVIVNQQQHRPFSRTVGRSIVHTTAVLTLAPAAAATPKASLIDPLHFCLVRLREGVRATYNPRPVPPGREDANGSNKRSPRFRCHTRSIVAHLDAHPLPFGGRARGSPQRGGSQAAPRCRQVVEDVPQMQGVDPDAQALAHLQHHFLLAAAGARRYSPPLPQPPSQIEHFWLRPVVVAPKTGCPPPGARCAPHCERHRQQALARRRVLLTPQLQRLYYRRQGCAVHATRSPGFERGELVALEFAAHLFQVAHDASHPPPR